MKRELDITVDLKVKEYNAIKLKQFDTTKLNFKILNDSISVDLTNLSADIIFTKPNKTIVLQSSNILITQNIASVTLIEECLRQAGPANIEVEFKENDETVSTFQIPVLIEPSSKDNVHSDNTPSYIEELEEAIVLEKQRQEAEKERIEAENIRQANETVRSDAEEERQANENDRVIAEEKRLSAENTRETNENSRLIAEEERQANENNRVIAEEKRAEEFQKIKDDAITVSVEDIAQLKKDVVLNKYILVPTEQIVGGTEFTIPCKYKVGANVLDVYCMGERLAKAIDNDTQGHYYEVGQEGSISNKLKLTSDWNADIGEYFEFIVRGEYDE